jgi:hypothetical protein
MIEQAIECTIEAMNIRCSSCIAACAFMTNVKCPFNTGPGLGSFHKRAHRVF